MIVFDQEGNAVNQEKPEDWAAEVKFYDRDLLKASVEEMNDPFVLPRVTEVQNGWTIESSGISLLPDMYGWKENCVQCHVPMRTAMISQQAKLEAVIVEEVLPIDRKTLPRVYKDWLVKQAINTNQSFWVCPSCRGIWTVAGTFWTRVRINGQERMEVERITTAEVKVMSEMEKAGEAPSSDSTLCPNCGVWREIKPYTETEIQHICPRCRCADAYPVKPEQGEE